MTHGIHVELHSVLHVFWFKSAFFWKLKVLLHRGHSGKVWKKEEWTILPIAIGMLQVNKTNKAIKRNTDARNWQQMRENIFLWLDYVACASNKIVRKRNVYKKLFKLTIVPTLVLLFSYSAFSTTGRVSQCAGKKKQVELIFDILNFY